MESLTCILDANDISGFTYYPNIHFEDKVRVFRTLSKVTHLLSETEFEPNGINSTLFSPLLWTLLKYKEGIIPFLEGKEGLKVIFVGSLVFLLLVLCVSFLYISLSLSCFSLVSSLPILFCLFFNPLSVFGLLTSCPVSLSQYNG